MGNIAETEVNLWTAVLNRSIADLEIPEERPSALAWFRSNATGIGSFRFVADVLDREPYTFKAEDS